MARKLTKKQEGFARDYLETGNGTQSALKNYDTEDAKTASVIAAENLAKPSIKAYLEDKASKAAEIVFEIAQFGENDSVKLSASKDILDRAGYKAVEKTQSMNLNVELSVGPELKELANELLHRQANT